ncbi:GNAT family N-acetyltransferase [Kribbella sp. NBC_01510]|uniref:GNAT family N-acetyltransferase n=1 Tax=Kribbella sp. NBC_01510 TaxID=2903581 RepID=UPI0038691297
MFDPSPDDLGRRLFEPRRALVATDGAEVIGTTRALTRDLSVPGGVVPAAHVTGVGVKATHRRRGVMSSLITRQLREVPEAIAVLWASEPGIYGRFGYGAAAWGTTYEITGPPLPCQEGEKESRPNQRLTLPPPGQKPESRDGRTRSPADPQRRPRRRFHHRVGTPGASHPGFARWIEQCRTSHVTPTAANYHDFAVSDPEGDHFRDSYAIGATEPDTIEYRYVFRTGAYGNGWVADLTVYRAHARPDREPLLTVWHSIRFSNADTSSIHQLAFRAVIHIIKPVKSLNRPQHTAPALQEWAQLATWHRARAGAA